MMKLSSNKKNKNMAFKLFKGMLKDNLEYTFQGNFTSKITDTILTLAETNLNNEETKKQVKKKVYFIMVEGLQNITRHQSKNNYKEISDYPGLFVLQKKKTGYFITTGNLISKTDQNIVQKHIEIINKLGRSELKKYSLKILNHGELSEKGGAGLGLIEIARKSGNKLLYDFKTISKDFSFFYMHTKIPFTNMQNKNVKEDEQESLQNIIKLHEILEDQNIILNFSGNFTQATLINLLSIIEKQLKSTIILKMKVFNLMVEMLQNIVKHADNYTYKEIKGKHAIFYISENENEIIFTSGNYIKNHKIKSFEELLNKINSLDRKTLQDLYNKILFSFDNNSDTHTGLGLIDIKIKSKTPYKFDFYKIDDEFSFFSLQIYIKKMKTSIVPYIVRETEDTPKIILDANNGLFKFSGISIPENAVSFYNPVIEWLLDYGIKPNNITKIIFDFSHFNTSSAKQIASIMVSLQKISKKSNVIIKWKYQKDDHEMMTEGLIYKEELTNLNINIVEKQ